MLTGSWQLLLMDRYRLVLRQRYRQQPGVLFSPRTPWHEVIVHLADEPETEWKPFAQPRQAMFECDDVAVNFGYVGVLALAATRAVTRFESQEVGHLGLGPLDTGTENRLEPDLWSDEEGWVRKQSADAAETEEGSSGVIE